MSASLVAGRSGAGTPRLQFPTVQNAARTALRFAEGGLAIPSIVDDHDTLIWHYPGGDPDAPPARQALAQLRVLASGTTPAYSGIPPRDL